MQVYFQIIVDKRKGKVKYDTDKKKLIIFYINNEGKSLAQIKQVVSTDNK